MSSVPMRPEVCFVLADEDSKVAESHYHGNDFETRSTDPSPICLCRLVFRAEYQCMGYYWSSIFRRNGRMTMILARIMLVTCASKTYAKFADGQHFDIVHRNE